MQILCLFLNVDALLIMDFFFFAVIFFYILRHGIKIVLFQLQRVSDAP